MRSKREKVKAGLVLIGGAFLLIATAGLVAGVRSLRPSHAYVIEITQSISGLEPGASVNYLGVRVGEVTQVALEPRTGRSVLVEIEVEPSVVLREGTCASLDSNLLTGSARLELSGGLLRGPEIPPGERIPWKGSGVSLFGEAVPAVLAELQGLAQQVRELLDPETRNLARRLIEDADLLLVDVRHEVHGLRQALEGAGTSLEERSERAVRGVESAADAVTQSANGLREELQAFREDVTGVIDRGAVEVQSSLDSHLAQAVDSLNQNLQVIAAAAEELREPAQNANELLVENRRRVDAALADLEAASRAFRELLQELRRSPSALLWSRPPRERRRGE